MKGYVSDFKRMSVHDGPGIRTTVFLKGCPLRCKWCHNPENLKMTPVLSYTEKLCVGCGACAEVCSRGVHGFEDVSALHILHHESCLGCGTCVDECYAGALKIYGAEMEAADVAARVLADRKFYEQSGGGVTFSGGEPLLQPDFLVDILKELKAEGIHTAIDTCGEVPWEAFEKVLPYADLFLFDVKHMDAGKHKEWTGVENGRILENLKKLSEVGAAVEIRTPVIPGINDDEETLQGIAKMLSTMENVTCWRVLPYHSMGKAKYDAIGLTYEMPEIEMPDNARMREICDMLKPVFERVMLSSDIGGITNVI